MGHPLIIIYINYLPHGIHHELQPVVYVDDTKRCSVRKSKHNKLIY